MVDKFAFFESYDKIFSLLEAEGDYEQAYFLFKAIRDYMFKGIEPDFEDCPKAELVWLGIFATLEKTKALEEKAKIDFENGKKGGRPRKNNEVLIGDKKGIKNPLKNPLENPPQKPLSKPPEKPPEKPEREKEREKEKEKELENELEKGGGKPPTTTTQPASIFVDAVEFVDGEPVDCEVKISPPTKEDIVQYIKDKGYQGYVNYEKFFNYYSERGWMKNQTPITNWKAKVDEWAVERANDQYRNNGG